MKKLLMATAAISTLAFATPALADGPNTAQDQETFTIQGLNPAKCNVVTESATYELPDNAISNNQGRASQDLANAIATRLNAAAITAWCTGNNNKLVLSRSAMTVGNGQATNNGFNRAAIYDIEVNVADSSRVGGSDAVNEGTSDGANNGPFITRFGAQDDGSTLVFRQEPGSNVRGSANAPTGELPRGSYNENNNRLVAGTYQGTVTVTLNPGV